MSAPAFEGPARRRGLPTVLAVFCRAPCARADLGLRRLRRPRSLRRRRIRSIRNPDSVEPSGPHQRRRRAGRGARTGTVPLHQVTLWLNDVDVTATFSTDTAARTMRGVLTGLEGGQNEFLADSNGRGHGRPRASLAITNHPIGGPVLLGSQTTPWICATPTPTADRATRRRRTRAACRPSRSTRNATSRPSTSSSTGRRPQAARARCRIRARRPRRRPTTASSRTPRAARRPTLR